MSKKQLKNPVVLTLDVDLVEWLRDFLYEESLSAEIDHEEVERLHTDVAIQAAKIELGRVNARLEKIIEAVDEALIDARKDATDVFSACEAIAKKIAAGTAGMPPVA